MDEVKEDEITEETSAVPVASTNQQCQSSASASTEVCCFAFLECLGVFCNAIADCVWCCIVCATCCCDE